MKSSIYERALEVMKENFSHVTVMSLASCADNIVSVRDLHAFYNNKKMYILSKTSNTLMHDIEKNPNVGLCHGSHSMRGIAKSLGHPLEPQNAAIRQKLKKEFSLNYNEYVSEENDEMRIIEISLTHAETYTRYHRYSINYTTATATRTHTEPYFIYR